MSTLIIRGLAVSIVAIALSGCSGMSGMNAGSLYSQLGGADAIGKLSGNLLAGAKANGELSSLLGNVNTAAATPKLNDQLCAALGGGCKPAFSADQVAAGAKKLNPSQTSALKDVFGSSLGKSGVNPALQGPVKDALGSQLSGIVGSLI
jgi:hypothetical protein